MRPITIGLLQVVKTIKHKDVDPLNDRRIKAS